MKRQISSLLMISVMLMTIAVVVSCGRDKLPPDYYKIGEDVYAIDNVRIINNGETEGGFNIDLRLYCENGKDFINFRIVSKEAERIPEGSYRDFEGSWIIGYNSNGSYTSMGSISSGSVVIARSYNDGYIIDIDCVDQYSNKVEGYFKGELTMQDENNLVHFVPEYVLPDEIYDEVASIFPIYSGVTPPDMEGEYVSSPHVLIYESYGENPDSIQYYSDRYIGFMYNNKQMNFYGKQYDSIQNKFFEEIQYGVKITGEDDHFTCYYVVDGYPGGYYAQQSFIFSGKKTDEGLEDFYTAVVLLETSGNPDMQPKHSYRVLKDGDGLAEAEDWLSKKGGSPVRKSIDKDLFKMWMK